MPTSSTAGAPSLRSVHATTTPMPTTHNCHSATGWIRIWCFVMQLKRAPVESRGACQYADACTTCFCWPARKSLRSQVRRGNSRPTAAKTSNSSNNSTTCSTAGALFVAHTTVTVPQLGSGYGARQCSLHTIQRYTLPQSTAVLCVAQHGSTTQSVQLS